MPTKVQHEDSNLWSYDTSVMVMAEIQQLARKHEERLHHHANVEAIQLLDNSELLRRL
jgi:hypothetical protein